MLINFSNHPYSLWGEKQRSLAADLYGSVRDLPFPQVDPAATEKEVLELAAMYYDKILEFFSREKSTQQPHAVHIQGEFTLVFALVTQLLKAGIPCVASTTQRVVTTGENGEKISRFDFVRFRNYKNIHP